MTLQNIRFIGGTKNNLFDKIAPSTNVIGTDKTIDLKERPRDRDFQKGDRLVCVKSREMFLTKGKIYVVTTADPRTVTLTGDCGLTGAFYYSDGYLHLNEPAPKGERYTRRRLVFIDALSRYEETCLVLDSMDDSEASELLHSLLGRNPTSIAARIPKPVATKPLAIRESSLIAALRYEKTSGTLDVTFKPKKDEKHGETYRYSNVPLHTVGALLTAPSLGSALTEFVKGKFEYLNIG